MIRSILLLILLSNSAFVSAQMVSASATVIKGKKVAYFYYRPDTVEHVIIGFHDAQMPERWLPETWVQELTWLADTSSSLIIVPSTDKWIDNENELLIFLTSIEQSIALDQVSFISLGSGAKLSCPLIKNGINGLFIAPISDCNLGDLDTVAPFSVLNTREDDSSSVWSDSLARKGQWVDHRLLISEDYYYIDRRKEWILSMMNWNDSMSLFLQDSMQVAQFKTEVVSPIPEVIKQGKSIKVEIVVAENGPFEVKLLNLSAKPVKEYKSYLGKGKHEFIFMTKNLDWGVYKLEVDGPGIIRKYKVMLRG